MEDTQFYHSTPVQIRFNDIDLLGHVNNAVINEYFDLGRMHYMQDTFGGQIFNGEAALIIASIHTDFIVPVYLKENLLVKTAIVHLGNKSLKMEQQLTDKFTGDVKAVCKSVMVAIDKVKTESITILPEWRAVIAQQEQKVL